MSQGGQCEQSRRRNGSAVAPRARLRGHFGKYLRATRAIFVFISKSSAESDLRLKGPLAVAVVRRLSGDCPDSGGID